MGHLYLAIGIFVLTCIGLVTEKIHKTLIALFSAMFIVLCHVITAEQAFQSVDLTVIFLLISMMLIVNVLGETGCFQWVAIQMFHISKGEPLVIMLLLSGVSAVTSAFLPNLTTVLLIAPVTIVLVQYLELDPVPFLLSEVLSSNIGGTATLIGDPPNLIIGSGAHLSFNQFVIHLTPVVIMVQICFMATMYFVFRKSFRVSTEVRARVHELDSAGVIKDKKLLVKTLIVLGIMIVAFFFQSFLHLDVAVIALTGATILLLISKYDVDKAFQFVEWPTIFFFVGLFIVVHGLVETGAIHIVGDYIFKVTRGNVFSATFVILWFSAFTSAIVDNIPFVVTMIPLVKNMGPRMAEHMHIALPLVMAPLWWALALGACLGGNGTVIGSSVNLVVAGMAQKSGYKITFLRFMKYGFPLMIESLIICSAYLYIRYLLPIHH